MLSMFNSAASDGPTLTPVRNKGTLEVISIIPRVILVGMAKAWKKEVFSGPKVVSWPGRQRQGARWRQHGPRRG